MANSAVAPFLWGSGGRRLTPEEILLERKNAQAMGQEAMSTAPVGHWSAGLNRVIQGLMSGYDNYSADMASKQNAGESSSIAKLLLGGASGVPGEPLQITPQAAPIAPVATGSSVSAPMGQTAIPAGREAFVSTLMPLAQEAAARTGIDPRIIVAQAAVESGWGKSAPGNNLFGIKSHGQAGGNKLATTEVVNGQPVRTSDSFRAYASPAESVQGYTNFINSNPRYAGLKSAQGIDAQLAALQQSGYATDPNYSAKVGSVARGLPETQGPVAPIGASQPPQTSAATALSPQAAPAAAPVSAAPAINPAIIQALSSPYVDANTKSIAGMLFKSQLEQQQAQNKVSTVDLGNAIGVMDARGNLVRQLPKGEPVKGPTFGEVGVDPQTGQPVRGFIDAGKGTVTPYSPQPTQPAQPSTIPPVPAGVDPKVWREAQSKRATEEAMPGSSDSASKLRGEVQQLPSYKNLAQAAPVYKSMFEAANRDTRAADVNMIYGMAKIMDPGSVVRESEMTVASAIATLPEQLKATVSSQLQGSGRLTPEVRAAIMQEARSRIGAYQNMFEQDSNFYRGVVTRGRMNVEDVVPSFGTFDEYKPAQPMSPQKPVTIDGYTIKAR